MGSILGSIFARFINNHALIEAVQQRRWEDVGHILQCGAPQSQRTWAVTEACQHAGEGDLIEYIIPHIHAEQDLEAAYRQLEREFLPTLTFTLKLRLLILRGLECNQVDWVVRKLEGVEDQILPHCSPEQIDSLVRETVRQWRIIFAWNIVEHGVSDDRLRWVVEQIIQRAKNDDSTTSKLLSRCFDDQLADVFKEAVKRHLWLSVEELMRRPIDDDLVRQAIQECYRSIRGESLTDYTLPARRDDQYRDFLLTDAVRGQEWFEIGELLQSGVHETLARLAIEEYHRRVCGESLTDYTLPVCCDDQCRDFLLTQAVALYRWREVGELLQKRVSDTLHRWAIEKASQRAYEDALMEDILYYCVEDLTGKGSSQQQHTVYTTSASETGGGSKDCFRERENIIDIILTEDEISIMLKNTQRRELWKCFSWLLELVTTNDVRPVVKRFFRWCNDDALSKSLKHCPRELLFFLLTLAVERNLEGEIKKIKNAIDDGGVLSDILCDWAKSVYMHHCPSKAEPETMASQMPDDMRDYLCDVVRQYGQRNVAEIPDTDKTFLTTRLEEMYCRIKITSEAEKTFATFLISTGQKSLNSTLSVEMLSTIPLLPSLQSVAVRLMLRDKRWDVISNAVLPPVWEDVRRSVLKAAVEQREWTTVKHMTDHSLYDDERKWALTEACNEKRWDVVLALADFGHDKDQLRRIYRQVAEHADWDTVLEMFERGADVQSVREELETASINQETVPTPAVLAGYKYRLGQVTKLENRVKSDAQNIQNVIEESNWRAVLHKVRRDATTLSLALHAAIEKEAWHIVVQLVRLGMDAAQRDSLFPEVIRRRQWGVGRALLECGFFDGGEHSVSVELRRAALPQLVNVGQWILVTRVMEHGVDDEERRQVMWEALDRREGSVVAHVISIMQDLVSVEDRERVFHRALRDGVWHALKRLVEFKDMTGVTHRDVIMRSAAKHHQWDILTHCLRHGADIDKRDAEGDTVLHRMVREEDWEGVERLLYHCEANPNLLDSSGRSVLHTAIKEPDKNWQGWRSDMVNWDIVKMLVKFHCDINQRSPVGHTPLQRMMEGNQVEVIKHCAIWGRDVGRKEVRWRGKTALHIVCEAGVLDTMHLIVTSGGNPLAVTRDGETILELAVWNRNHPQELLAECIKLGVSTHQPRITDRRIERALLTFPNRLMASGRSPMYWAVRLRSKAITEMMYESGSCSSKELRYIAHAWSHPDIPICADQVAYVSMIASTPRSLQSACRLVISHHIGACSPSRREERVKQLPVLSPKLKNYVLFSDLTDPDFGKESPQRSISTAVPAWYQFDTDAE